MQIFRRIGDWWFHRKYNRPAPVRDEKWLQWFNDFAERCLEKDRGGQSFIDLIYQERGLLYVRPTGLATTEPILDSLTKRMLAALRRAKSSPWVSLGTHQCVCGVSSEYYDLVLSSGQVTNSLSAHYLAFHRAEVPPEEIAKLTLLPTEEVEPLPTELQYPKQS